MNWNQPHLSQTGVLPKIPTNLQMEGKNLYFQDHFLSSSASSLKFFKPENVYISFGAKQ